MAMRAKGHGESPVTGFDFGAVDALLEDVGGLGDECHLK